LSIQRLGLKIKKQSPRTSKGRWFVPDQGVIRDLSLATLHAAKTKQSENAVLELEPSASHRLNTSKLDEHIGPQHVMSDPTRTGRMLMRPLFLILVIDPNGRITKARVGNQTRQVYKGTQVKVLGGRVRILPDNTLLVDWRP